MGADHPETQAFLGGSGPFPAPPSLVGSVRMSLIAFLLAAAVATEAPPAAGPEEPKDEMVCRREAATGSKRMEKICRPKAVVEAEAAERERNSRVNRRLLASDRGVRPRGDISNLPR